MDQFGFWAENLLAFGFFKLKLLLKPLMFPGMLSTVSVLPVSTFYFPILNSTQLSFLRLF